ncbi:uncharacterized protein LOC135704845 [Ochlerotatus camptorhynchus]|uniref:uncharacterized protein LOC135704845 n=1 Tax=Ochlerotatus camptorhynchus TaxID=644619 RepID=UPI0031D41074
MYEPIAMKTRLGWIVCGGADTGEALVGHHSHSVHTCPCSERSDEMLQQAERDYFSLGSEQRILESATRKESGRYEVSLLWKFDDIELPNSKPAALRHFHCSETRMKKQPELAEVLRAKIEDYRLKGYIRKLSDEERVWYLPLFPMFNPNKPGKVRIVWDAAAKTNGVSLISMLLTGPDLLTPLDYVLYRFREFLVELSGDIREMYLQVFMCKKDQYCIRVLWCDDSFGNPSTYVAQVMPFGSSCSPSCAQYVKNLNAHRFESQYLVSVESEQEAIQIAKDVKFVHAHAVFDMRNWISNSSAVVEAMREENTDEKSLKLGMELGTEKVLGLLSNVFIYLKVLFQEVWRAGIGWDDVIPESLNKKWEKWLKILPKVQDISIPRCYRFLTANSCVNGIDRGTNFTAASKELAASKDPAASKELTAVRLELEVELKEVDLERIIQAVVGPGTEWTFLPPHMGGAWERLIQSVKKNLAVMKPERNPTDKVLRNMLAEVETVINYCPQMHVPRSQADTVFDNRTVILRRAWCASQVEANIFWRRWVQDYLPNLTKRTKWFNEVKPIEVNDIVVVVDPGLPRNCRPKGRIISNNRSKDGQMRSAAV